MHLSIRDSFTPNEHLTPWTARVSPHLGLTFSQWVCNAWYWLYGYEKAIMKTKSFSSSKIFRILRPTDDVLMGPPLVLLLLTIFEQILQMEKKERTKCSFCFGKITRKKYTPHFHADMAQDISFLCLLRTNWFVWWSSCCCLDLFTWRIAGLHGIVLHTIRLLFRSQMIRFSFLFLRVLFDSKITSDLIPSPKQNDFVLDEKQNPPFKAWPTLFCKFWNVEKLRLWQHCMWFGEWSLSFIGGQICGCDKGAKMK